MLLRKTILLLGVWAALGGATLASETPDLETGSPDIKSVDVLAFSPEGLLLVGDSVGASIFAIDVADTSAASQEPLQIEDVDKKIAALLGTAVDQIHITDLAVHPLSRRPYMSVTRGRGGSASPSLIRANASAGLEVVPLRDIRFARIELADAPAPDSKDRRGRPLRTQSITDLAYHNGTIYVAGLSNEEFASSLRRIPFPFKGVSERSSLEIFHSAHGQYETHSPIRTFMPFNLGGEPFILASYTCTPLVAFPINNLTDGAHVRGKTVAELGAGNSPLDMIAYQSGQDGKTYLLIANNRRTMMKIDPTSIIGADSITEPVTEAYGTAGVGYISVPLQGVLHLDDLNQGFLVMIQRDIENGSLNLVSRSKRRM